MKCERCNIAMDKKSVVHRLGYDEEKKETGYVISQEPINARSIYICPECGKIELNIKV